MTTVVLMDSTATAANPLAGLCNIEPSPAETHLGETYRTERREIATFTNRRGYRVVWCWEVLSGPAEGHYGGKCASKREAAKWAKHEIKAWADEVAAQSITQNA